MKTEIRYRTPIRDAALRVAFRKRGCYLVPGTFVRFGRTVFPENRGARRPMPDDLHNETMTWRVHPARERIGAACLAVGVMAAFAWLAVDWMQNLWWGLFAGLFLFAMLNRFFLPSRFVIDAEGITARYPWRSIRFRFQDVRRFLHDARGGYLSTRRRGSILDSFQGIHLFFNGNRDHVVARIRAGMRKKENETP